MKRKITLLLSLILALTLLTAPLVSGAEQPQKTVRVGWYESSYNTTDPSGQRTGYAYEYQMKIAAYTGWRFEYVTGSWSDLLQMLIDGKVDLMSDVSYTPERAEKMLYPTLPMGTEEYYVFIAPGNHDITPTDLTSLNGRRIAVNKDSVQADQYRDWAKKNGVDAELIEVTYTEEESLKMLASGELDAYVTVDSFADPSLAVPVIKVGGSDFFFAVSKARPDLLEDLNAALNRIQDENRYYNQRMYEQYIQHRGANAFLSEEETAWLEGHGPIRVGYQDNYMAFCAADKSTGELTGVLKDYLNYASGCLANVTLEFETAAYPNVSAALTALRRGEIDCVFPANFTSSAGESKGLVISPPLLDTELYAVVRRSEENIFSKKDHVIVAVNEGNPNYDATLQQEFSDWQKVYYPTTEECLKAVGEGVADCVLLSNYRYNNIARLCTRYRLTAYTTDVGINYCFAVKRGQTELYSILSKAIGQVPGSFVSASLATYITADARLSFSDFLMEHFGLTAAVIGAILLLILFLLIRSIRSERKAKALIAATETDELTGLYSRNYFFEYAYRMFREHPETPMDALVFNIERFHSVNDLYGREFGDRVLQSMGGEIKAIAEENGGIAGRFSADRFDIYCRRGADYPAIYKRVQAKLDELAPGGVIRLRMGAAAGQKRLEPVLLFDRARTACNKARGHYMEHLIVFNEQIRERELFEQRLMNDLRRALDKYEFEVYYQPKFDIRSEQPKLVSAEALIRWNHPEIGLIHPDEFIPLLEGNGHIREVDEYVWNEAAGQIVRWREQYGVTLPVSVNLSRIDVFDPALELTLERIMTFHNLTRDLLKLEVTETAYTENAGQVIRVVESLREKGYVVELDDFGTGYSSLNMLTAMPLDYLKMDRTFVRNMEHSERDARLVEMILGTAKGMNVPVIAEGVETGQQLRMLRERGCEIVQGYYFSRPLPAADFEAEFLAESRPAQ